MEPLATPRAPAREKPDLALLQQALAAACRRPEPDLRRKEILGLLVDLTNAAAGAYLLLGQSGYMEIVAEVTAGRGNVEAKAVQKDLLNAAATSCKRQRLVVIGRGTAGSATILASPLQGREGPIGALSLVLFLGAAPAETFATVIQLTASLAAELELRQPTSRSPFETNRILALLTEVRSSSDADTACLAVAEALAEACGADQVAVGLAPARRRQPTRLKALSGVTEFDPRSDVVRSLEGALSTSRQTSGWRQWRRDSHHSAPELRVAAERMNARLIWVGPIACTGSGPIGSVALLFSDPVQGGENIPTTASQLIAAVADTLDAFRQGAVLETPERKRLGGRAKALIGLTLAIAVAGLLMLPTDHRLKAPSQLEPETRRFVVAPFDGVLEASRFKPGDGVEPGDILATLDGRELELELVSLRAQRDKLSKQRDVSLAAGETAATQITELELARTRAGLGLLEYKRNHLEVRSPIRGVVTLGDLSREKGSPVHTGQRLFELAPLDRMVAEVELPARDIAYYLDGAPAELTLDAFPRETLKGPVGRLHPRSTIRDGRNVFLAEIDLDNPDLRLRPGMRGEVEITVGRRTLGWVLFHRAWEKAVQWLK